MNSLSFSPSLIRTFVAAAIALCASISSSHADMQLGRFTCTNAAARTLKTTTSLASSLGQAPRIRFVAKVGGVAFDAVAIPAAEFKISTLELSYDPTKEDGSRLVLHFNGEPVTCSLFDWELLPIARYAASDSTSCFTLFGDLEDKAAAEQLRNQGHRILNYDAAFENTLMGLRLFQLDVLLIDDDFATDLPKDENGYVLGAGEEEPQLDEAGERMDDYRLMRRALTLEGELDGFDTDADSWVITDHAPDRRGSTQQVSFSLINGKLQIAGTPFFYFWKEDEIATEAAQDRFELQALTEEGLAEAHEEIHVVRARLSETSDQYDDAKSAARVEIAKQKGWISQEGNEDDVEGLIKTERATFGDRRDAIAYDIGREKGLVRDDEDADSFFFRIRIAPLIEREPTKRRELEDLRDRLHKAAASQLKAEDAEFKDWEGLFKEAEPEIEKLVAAEKDAWDQLEAKLERVQSRVAELMEVHRDGEEATGAYLQSMSQRHVTLAKLLAEVNPAVWSAGEKVLCFSAFFRYCKDQHPDAWRKFIQQLEQAAPGMNLPAVTTPAVLRIPENGN